MTQAIVPGSLSAIAKRDGTSLAESFISADAVIIVDTSGSMRICDSYNGRSRYDVALEELAQLQARMPGKLVVLAFSDNCIFVPGGQPPLLDGGTDLAGALEFAKIADVPGMRFVVISDGEPNDDKTALAIAGTYNNRIDTIYVGSEDDESGGRTFLQQLAAVSGGQHIAADRVQQLAEKAKQLLLTA